MNDDDIDLCVRLYERGWPAAKIAEEFDTDEDTIIGVIEDDDDDD